MKPAQIVISRVLVVLALVLFWLSVALIFTPAKADVYCAFCIVNGGGEQGEQGPRGPRGSTGATGAQGEQGEQGDIGLTGEAGINGTDGKDYLHDDDSWSNDDLDQMFAASTAMAGIDFDSTTSKLQLGVAIGGYGGEQQGAVGIGKVLNNDKFGDVLVSFKTTIEETGRDDERPWVASATWKVRID